SITSRRWCRPTWPSRIDATPRPSGTSSDPLICCAGRRTVSMTPSPATASTAWRTTIGSCTCSSASYRWNAGNAGTVAMAATGEASISVRPGPSRMFGMSLDPKLLEVLACPKDKGPLRYLESEQLLVNERLGLAYRIDDGIPVLLIDE